LYALQVLNLAEGKNLKVEDHPMLWEFKEVPRLPPKRDLDFSLDLVPGAVITSKIPYRMRTPELVEMKV
jgi:hypothetical protein